MATIYCNSREYICGSEAVCLLIPGSKLNAKSKICMCPSDGSLPTSDLKCRIKKSNSSSVTNKIQVSVSAPGTVMKSNSNNSTFLSNSTAEKLPNSTHNLSGHPTTSNDSSHVRVIAAVSGLVLFAFMIMLIWRYLFCTLPKRRRKMEKQTQALAIPLKKTLLMEERYTLNPQYIANTPEPIATAPDELLLIPSVPIFGRDMISNLHKIGEGFFGKVYKGQITLTDENGMVRLETVAIKMLKRTTNIEAEEDFLREVENMSSFNHPNILSLIGLCPREDSVDTPWMIFEFMPFGDLINVLRNSNHQFWTSVPTLPALSPESLLDIASQIADGMEYLARQRFVHRDLACRNCLVGYNLVVKISDFGMSRDVYTCDYYKQNSQSKMLPVRWMAPECILFGKYTLESDIYSYGVVLYEIYSYGKQPYFGYSNEEAVQLILCGVPLQVPSDCPEEIAFIMKSCLHKETKERMIFSEICARLTKYKEKMSYNRALRLPRPPLLPVVIDHPAFLKRTRNTDDETDNLLLDDEEYVRPISRSQSLISFDFYIEPI